MLKKISIDIISDVSCPWCIIGYKAFAKAIDQLDMQKDIDLNWMPFELNPTMGPEGQNRNDYIREKYGLTPEQGDANRQNLITRGAELGYKFNFPDDGRVYNTFNAHRLIHWAKEANLQTELKLALFDLFFQQEGNPSNDNDLISCVAKVGLDIERATQILNSSDYEEVVRKDLLFPQQNNISAVPAFILHKKYLISGGQSVETFVQALEQLKQEII